MRIVRLDELPKWSPWPARLLGLKLWHEQDRTPERVSEEYDEDKYAKCLGYASAFGKDCTTDDVREFELGGEPDKEICISVGDDLRVMTVAEARRRMNALLYSTMYESIAKAKTVVELGCGYGYNLHALRAKVPNLIYVGGEISPNAVKLARDLFAGDARVKVRGFDLLDPESYEFLGALEGPVVVFTCHAVEQIRLDSVLLDTLCARRDGISDVFHFEPVYSYAVQNSLLGIMRKRYIEINGYNRNLGFDLKAGWGDRIKVVSRKENVFGFNPLNPTSAIHWRFK